MTTLTIDTETTGLPGKEMNYETDYMQFPHIVSIGYKINDQPTKSFILNLGDVVVPDEATAIHGITTEMCRQSPHKLDHILQGLVKEAMDSQEVIGHNLYFDTSIIKANCLRMQRTDLFNDLTSLLHKDKRVNTMQKTIKFCGLKKWPKLTELYMKCFGEEFNAHSVADDVDATYRCFVYLRGLGIL